MTKKGEKSYRHKAILPIHCRAYLNWTLRVERELFAVGSDILARMAYGECSLSSPSEKYRDTIPTVYETLFHCSQSD